MRVNQTQTETFVINNISTVERKSGVIYHDINTMSTSFHGKLRGIRSNYFSLNSILEEEQRGSNSNNVLRNLSSSSTAKSSSSTDDGIIMTGDDDIEPYVADHSKEQSVIVFIYIAIVALLGAWFLLSVGRLTYRCCKAVRRHSQGYETVVDGDDEDDDDDEDGYGRLRNNGKLDENGNIIARKPRAPKRYTFDNDQDDDGYTQISGLTFGYKTVDLMTLNPNDDQPTVSGGNRSSYRQSNKPPDSLLKASGYSSQQGGGSYSGGGSYGYDYDLATIIQKQQHGYFSVVISIVQTIVMIIMISMEMYQHDSTLTWHQFLFESNLGNDANFHGYGTIHDNPMLGPPDPQTNDILAAMVGTSKESTLFAIFDHGDWFRLLTPVLFHGGLIHLFVCVLIQLQIGYQFECEWGTFIYVIVYFTSVVGSTFLSLKILPNEPNIAIGSSGAIMGLFGGKMAEVVYRCCETAITDRDHVGRDMRQRQCCIIMPMVLVIMILSIVATNVCPYVDWAYHLGGLIFGFCIAMILFSSKGLINKEICTKLFFLVLGIGLFIICILFIT